MYNISLLVLIRATHKVGSDERGGEIDFISQFLKQYA